MDAFFKRMWENNKIVFILLIPIILLLLFGKGMISILRNSIEKLLSDSKKQDASLKEQADAANLEAEKERQKAADLEKQIQNRDTSDVNEDWNKK